MKKYLSLACVVFVSAAASAQVSSPSYGVDSVSVDVVNP